MDCNNFNFQLAKKPKSAGPSSSLGCRGQSTTGTDQQEQQLRKIPDKEGNGADGMNTCYGGESRLNGVVHGLARVSLVRPNYFEAVREEEEGDGLHLGNSTGDRIQQEHVQLGHQVPRRRYQLGLHNKAHRYLNEISRAGLYKMNSGLPERR